MSETNPDDIKANDAETPVLGERPTAADPDSLPEEMNQEIDSCDDAEKPNSSWMTELENSIETEPTEDKTDDPADRVDELESQVSELNDRLLRALAEAENVRRRAQRDKEDTAKYGIKNFAEGMLAVADNLGRALASIDVDAHNGNESVETIIVGIEMVQKDLISTFERYGIKAVAALGAKFDPMQHEAMFEIEDKNRPAGIVAQVLEPGYVLHGRTLRAAKVGITKGGAKEVIPEENPSDDSEEGSPDSTTRDGQAAYENQTEDKTPAGGKLDQEL
jgi:molecular chaperone GrpE